MSPYFDESFYVGFNVGGFELTLDPNGDANSAATTYWGVADIAVAVDRLIAVGALLASGIDDVGDDIRVATLHMPGSKAPLGIIQNPHYHHRAVDSAGPGR